MGGCDTLWVCVRRCGGGLDVEWCVSRSGGVWDVVGAC